MCALFLAPEVPSSTEGSDMAMARSEASMKEFSQENDLRHKVAILSNDLKGSNCLSPRRVLQTPSFSIDIRLLKQIERETYTIRLKGMNMLRNGGLGDMKLCRGTGVAAERANGKKAANAIIEHGSPTYNDF